MKWLATIVLALLCSVIPAKATTYFIAPAGAGGSDSNNGLSSGAPFLTPNHAFNCGDVVLAAAGNYVASSFTPGNWGTVTCPSANNVTWLKCATFDTCKVAGVSANAMKIGSSFWGVQGWELSTTGTSASCLAIQSTSGIIYHIIIANNVMNGCISSGITTANTGTTASEDYLAILGNVVWNAAQTTAFCDSGITIYEPLALDSAPGTHIYIAGNFSFDNTTPTNCNGGSSTFDGEGIILDSLDFGQGGGPAYLQQVVVDNNIAVFNGSWGITSAGSGSIAPVYFRDNTMAKNTQAANTNNSTCGEIVLFASPNVVSNAQAFGNLAVTKGATSCSGGVQTLYTVFVLGGGVTDKVYANYLYSAAGNNIGVSSSAGFVSGPNNITGTDPVLANPVDPGQPSCGSFADVPHCMATVISNFTPTVSAAKQYGYQIPGTASIYDPLYPVWLCTVTNLPTGLVTPGCLTGTSQSGGVTISSGVTIH